MNDLRTVLNQIFERASTPAEQGGLFERLIQRYLREDPIYRDRFTEVLRWPEWADRHSRSAQDTGVDLVAEERDGGYCAIQCKCYSPGTTISKADLDSFLAESGKQLFTTRMVVDTGHEWGPNAQRTIRGQRPEVQVLQFADLAKRHVDWPNLLEDPPEALRWRTEPFEVRKHWQQAISVGITEDQTAQMEAANLQLVVPSPYHDTYTESQRRWLWTLRDFLGHVEDRAKK